MRFRAFLNGFLWWPLALACGLAMAQGDASVAALTGETGFHKQLEAIHRLPADLSPSALNRWFQYLKTPTGAPGEAVLKNDLLNALRAQKKPSQKLTETLQHMYRNQAQSPQVRDYAIQHLGAWHGFAGNREAVRNTLWQASGEGGNSIAGTALLAMLRLSRSGTTIDGDRLRATALSIASQQGNSTLSRLSALRVCGELGVMEAGAIARDVLKQHHPDISFQLAAVATLGDVGGPEDRALLEQLTAHPRLGRAAETALEKLAHKFSQT